MSRFLTTKCLRPPCKNHAQHGKRGLCGTCYNAACDAIKLHGKTWTHFVAANKALPKREKAIDWFLEDVNDKSA